jgi:hypothetical protein
MSAPDRKPDAVILPPSLPGMGMDKLVGVNRLYGPVLGSQRVRCHPPCGGHSYYFGTSDEVPFQTLFFGSGHSRAKESRYDWFPGEVDSQTKVLRITADDPVIEPDGTVPLFGFLKEGANDDT